MDETSRAKVRDEVDVSELGPVDFGAISELITSMDRTGSEKLRIRDKSADYYVWMYQKNPVGSAVVVGAKHNGRLVATFAIAPKLFHLGGEERIVGKTMDMFTHPGYQGLGLMSLCARGAFTRAAERGMSTIFVTPSPNSHPIFLHKFHYREEFEAQYLARVINLGRMASGLVQPAGLGRMLSGVTAAGDRIAAHWRRPRLPSGFDVEESAAFGPLEEQLWRHVAPYYGVATVRSSAYLNWRYVENPDSYRVLKLWYRQKLVGFVVLKHTLRRGLPVGEIVDYVCGPTDEQAFRLLMRMAIAALRENGASLVEAWVIPGTIQEHRFREIGLRLRRATNKFLLSPDAPAPEFYEKDAWLLTLGDGNDV